MTERVSLKVFVSGRVQGVSFREYTRRKALELGLAGYVKNLPEGSVEVFASGIRPALEKLLAYLRHGPPRASINNVSATWGEDSAPISGFEIRF